MAEGITRWGPLGDLSYWTAVSQCPDDHSVRPPERRAVELLQQICDSKRTELYLHSGVMPVLGNRTKHTYLITRSGAVIELDDGYAIASWCMHILGQVPETDQVLTVKGMIEGNEDFFRKTANGSLFDVRDDYVENNPYRIDLGRMNPDLSHECSFIDNRLRPSFDTTLSEDTESNIRSYRALPLAINRGFGEYPLAFNAPLAVAHLANPPRYGNIRICRNQDVNECVASEYGEYNEMPPIPPLQISPDVREACIARIAAIRNGGAPYNPNDPDDQFLNQACLEGLGIGALDMAQEDRNFQLDHGANFLRGIAFGARLERAADPEVHQHTLPHDRHLFGNPINEDLYMADRGLDFLISANRQLAVLPEL